MVERHTILTDDTFYHSKYVDMIQRHFGIKDLRKESQNKDSKFYGQYEILKDIFQTFILVFNCFFSDSNVGIETQANEARDRIDELIYKNDISQKHKYSPNAIKNLCDKRARRLFNLMVAWRNDDLLNIVANKTKILDRLIKEMKELEEVGFDNVVSNDFEYQTKWLKYYTKYSIIISKFDNIYSDKENFIKDYKEYYYNENGVELTDDDIEEITPPYRLVANANNGLAKVISNYKIEDYNINERSSAKYIYKAYLKSLRIDYNNIATFEETSQIFKVALTLLGNEVNKKGHFTIDEVIDNFDMFSFLVSMEQVVEKDINSELKDIDKILTDLKEVYRIINSIEDVNDLDKTIKEYYIPAYNIIKSIIKRKNNMCFVEVS